MTPRGLRNHVLSILQSSDEMKGIGLAADEALDGLHPAILAEWEGEEFMVMFIRVAND